MNIQDKLFAVTDQHHIIPLKIITITELEEGYHKLITEIVGSSGEHSKSHHKAYFTTIYLSEGVLQKQDVFKLESEAKKYALTNLNYDKDSLFRKLKRLKEREEVLNK